MTGLPRTLPGVGKRHRPLVEALAARGGTVAMSGQRTRVDFEHDGLLFRYTVMTIGVTMDTDLDVLVSRRGALLARLDALLPQTPARDPGGPLRGLAVETADPAPVRRALSRRGAPEAVAALVPAFRDELACSHGRLRLRGRRLRRSQDLDELLALCDELASVGRMLGREPSTPAFPTPERRVLVRRTIAGGSVLLLGMLGSPAVGAWCFFRWLPVEPGPLVGPTVAALALPALVLPALAAWRLARTSDPARRWIVDSLISCLLAAPLVVAGVLAWNGVGVTGPGKPWAWRVVDTRIRDDGSGTDLEWLVEWTEGAVWERPPLAPFAAMRPDIPPPPFTATFVVRPGRLGAAWMAPPEFGPFDPADDDRRSDEADKRSGGDLRADADR